MKIVIDNIEQFRNFFNVIYEESSEVLELQLKVDKMVCTVLDKSRTKFFHVEYDARFFDVYDVNGDESVFIYIEDLYHLLKSCLKSDTLFLEVNDPYLVAKIESDNGSSRVFEFVLPSDFVESPVPPHAEFPTICEVDIGDLEISLKDIDLIGSDLYVFNVANGQLNITTDPNIATKYVNSVIADFEKSVDGSSGFTLKFIKQMLKFKKINKKVKLKLGQDLPVFYSFEDELMGVRVDGMIAPRISED